MPRLHLAPGSHYCHPMSALSDSGLTLIDMGLSANRLPRNQKKCMINICSILSHSNGNLLNFGCYTPFSAFSEHRCAAFSGETWSSWMRTSTLPHSVPNEVKIHSLWRIRILIYSYSIRDVILLKV